MEKQLEEIGYSLIHIDDKIIERILTDDKTFNDFISYCHINSEINFIPNRQLDYLYAIQQYLDKHGRQSFDSERITQLKTQFALLSTVLLLIKDEKTFSNFCFKKTNEFNGIKRDDILWLCRKIYTSNIKQESKDSQTLYVSNLSQYNRLMCLRCLFI